MRRLWILLLLAAVLTAVGMPEMPAQAEKPEMRISVSDGDVLPGQAVIVSFTVPDDGICDILLVDETDPSRRVVRHALHVLYAVHIDGLVDADDM